MTACVFAGAGSKQKPKAGAHKGTRLPIDTFTPEGESEEKELDGEWETDPEHKWIYGGHPDMTAEQKQQLKAMLLQEQGAFAYSLAELPGYTGDLGEVSKLQVHIGEVSKF
jgi:hypothetical protein